MPERFSGVWSWGEDAVPVSQNLLFIATAPKDSEFDQPPGAGLMRVLVAELARLGWDTDEMDNWRDCGWFVRCRCNSSELEVVLGQVESGEWLLQVNPCRVPGVFGTLLGRRPSAMPSDVYSLAVAVHRALSSLRSFENPRWCWDGFPDEKPSTAEPPAV